MRLYHRTSDEGAREILAHGFRDGYGYYLTAEIHRGVWLSNVPLDEDEGTVTGPVLAVELAIGEAELEQFEWVEEEKPYRVLNDGRRGGHQFG